MALCDSSPFGIEWLYHGLRVAKVARYSYIVIKTITYKDVMNSFHSFDMEILLADLLR